MADTLINGLKRINRLVAVIVGLGLLVCVGFVLLDIVLRQGFNLGHFRKIGG